MLIATVFIVRSNKKRRKMSIPINMPRNKHYGSNYIETYSIKNNRVIRLFSNLEYYNFLTVELEQSIVSFTEQPSKVTIYEDPELGSSVFDMYILRNTGIEEFWEVKYNSELNDRRSESQTNLQQLWCEEKGYIYRIRTEDDIILSPIYISNLSYIYHRLLLIDYKTIRERSFSILKEISTHKTTTIKALREKGFDIEDILDSLAYLYYYNIFVVNTPNIQLGCYPSCCLSC